MSSSSNYFTDADLHPAELLEDVIYLCNPQQSLSERALDAFYVDRNNKARIDMRVLLQANDLRRGQSVKLLFSGHKGSGKSTELNKLCTELDDRFFIVKVSTSQIVSPTDLTHIDIILLAAIGLHRAAVDRKVIEKAPAETVNDLWKNMTDFFRNRIFGLDPTAKFPEPPEVSAKISYWVAEFEAKYKFDVATRDRLLQQYRDHLAELIQRIDELALVVRVTLKKPVLFVFDDTDKPDLKRGREIFFDHAKTLTSFQASAIYTFDIALWYENEFRNLQNHFPSRSLLSNITVYSAKGKLEAEGVALLREILARRISPQLIEEDARKLLIVNSGGLVRELIAMAQFAATNALGRGSQRIEVQDVQRAERERRNDFIAALDQQEYATLVARNADKRLSSDDDVQTLLGKLALLQYENGETWCDVHPIVKRLLEERGNR